MKELLGWLWKQDEGQDLVEYALLLVLLALVVAGSMKSLGLALNSAFQNAAANLSAS